MPKEYEAIRDRLAASGTGYDEAQSTAAATYNKRHPGEPMGTKLTKKEVMYHSALKGEGRCRDCQSFSPPDRCKRVGGSIEQTATCYKFRRANGRAK